MVEIGAETRSIAAVVEPNGSECPGSHLLVIEGTSSRIVPLPTEGDWSIGRAQDSELRLEDASVSRRHARLLFSGALLKVADLDSHNGTRINGIRIQGTRVLAPGDTISIGDVTLVPGLSAGASNSRGLIDYSQFCERLDDEIERALTYACSLSVLVLAIERSDFAPAGFLRKLGSRILAARDPHGHLVVVLPEHAPSDVLARIEPMTADAQQFPIRIGFAGCPADGCDGASLLDAAHAGLATNGARISRADAASFRITLGKESVLVADPAMCRIFELIRKVAASELPVLIFGETGSGKENAALAVHHFSARQAGAFVTVNCAALPEELFESEVFGHEKGAFSGAFTAKAGILETADKGTLFLDEIGELGMAAQAKLLRVLDSKKVLRLGELRERSVDVRIVAATNRDLAAQVAAGRFRQDLFYRLTGATIVLPPLRARPREILLLARTFLGSACERMERETPTLSLGAICRLARYSWPGNVRELKNAMEYLAATVPSEVVEEWDLPPPVGPNLAAATGPGSNSTPNPPAMPNPVTSVSSGFRPLAEEMRELERMRIEEALQATGGVQTRAAELIGMPLRTFLVRLKQYGICAGRRSS